MRDFILFSSVLSHQRILPCLVTTKWNNITAKSLASFSKYNNNNNKYHTSSHFNRSHCNKCSKFSIFSTFPDFQQSIFKHSYTILRKYTVFCHFYLKLVFNCWLRVKWRLLHWRFGSFISGIGPQFSIWCSYNNLSTM